MVLSLGLGARVRGQGLGYAEQSYPPPPPSKFHRLTQRRKCTMHSTHGGCTESAPSSITFGAQPTIPRRPILPPCLTALDGWDQRDSSDATTTALPGSRGSQPPKFNAVYTSRITCLLMCARVGRSPRPSHKDKTPGLWCGREVQEGSLGSHFPRSAIRQYSLILLRCIAWECPPAECTVFFLCPPGAHTPGCKESFVCGRVSCFSFFLLNVLRGCLRMPGQQRARCQAEKSRQRAESPPTPLTGFARPGGRTPARLSFPRLWEGLQRPLHPGHNDGVSLSCL